MEHLIVLERKMYNTLRNGYRGLNISLTSDMSSVILWCISIIIEQHRMLGLEEK